MKPKSTHFDLLESMSYLKSILLDDSKERKVFLDDKVLWLILEFFGIKNIMILQILSKNWFTRIDQLIQNFCHNFETGF